MSNMLMDCVVLPFHMEVGILSNLMRNYLAVSDISNKIKADLPSFSR